MYIVLSFYQFLMALYLTSSLAAEGYDYDFAVNCYS